MNLEDRSILEDNMKRLSVAESNKVASTKLADEVRKQCKVLQGESQCLPEQFQCLQQWSRLPESSQEDQSECQIWQQHIGHLFPFGIAVDRCWVDIDNVDVEVHAISVRGLHEIH